MEQFTQKMKIQFLLAVFTQSLRLSSALNAPQHSTFDNLHRIKHRLLKDTPV